MDGEVEHNNEPTATTNGENHTEVNEEVAEEANTAASEENIQSERPAADNNVENDNEDRPVVELFIKAAVDKMKSGSCPICHRYFLVFYILRERGLIDLVVTTFLPENPPKEVLEFSNGKHFPLVKVHKGIDSTGVDLAGLECDTIDDIEQLVDRFDCDEMLGRTGSNLENKAELVFEGLYTQFNAFLKNTNDNSVRLVKALEKINDHLEETETQFMVGETLTRADCYLLPTLQHIRVAGKAYKEFEIPTELTYLWRYLGNAYGTEAFQESCPADREIISHYQQKASSKAKIPRKRAELMAEDRTFSVPTATVLDSGDSRE